MKILEYTETQPGQDDHSCGLPLHYIRRHSLSYNPFKPPNLQPSPARNSSVKPLSKSCLIPPIHCQPIQEASPSIHPSYHKITPTLSNPRSIKKKPLNQSIIHHHTSPIRNPNTSNAISQPHQLLTHQTPRNLNLRHRLPRKTKCANS